MRWQHRIAALGGFAALGVIGLACAPITKRPDVVIATASSTGIYYPLGGSMCRLFNLDSSRHGLRCSEEPSSGSVANIESLRLGRLEVGILPSDVLADAAAAQGSFAARGPTTGLRILLRFWQAG